MRIKKCRHPKGSWKVIATLMLGASLLGTSYAYWNDELVIEARIRTLDWEVDISPSFEFEEMSNGNKKIKIEAGYTSKLPYELVGYEIYTKRIDGVSQDKQEIGLQIGYKDMESGLSQGAIASSDWTYIDWDKEEIRLEVRSNDIANDLVTHSIACSEDWDVKVELNIKLKLKHTQSNWETEAILTKWLKKDGKFNHKSVEDMPLEELPVEVMPMPLPEIVPEEPPVEGVPMPMPLPEVGV